MPADGLRRCAGSSPAPSEAAVRGDMSSALSPRSHGPPVTGSSAQHTHPERATGTDTIASCAGGPCSPWHSGAALLAEQLPACAEPAPGMNRGFQPPGLLIHLLWPVPCSGNRRYQCLYCRGRLRRLQRLTPRCGHLQAGQGTLADLQKRSSSQPQSGM